MRTAEFLKPALVGLTWLSLMAPAQAGLIFAQDGEKANCLERHSKAWCLLDAAKMAKEQIVDIKPEVVEKAMKDAPGDVAWTAGAVAGLGTGVFKPAPGLSRGFEGGMLVLGLLSALSNQDLLGWNGIFGWMPAELASDEADARRKVAQIIKDATLSVFSDYDLTLELGRPDIRKETYGLKLLGQAQFRMKGGDCSDRECLLKVLQTWGHVTRSKAPEWMGGAPAWGLSTRFGTSDLAFMPYRLVIDGIDRTPQYLGRLSKALPPWLYIYVSPQSKTYWGTSNVGQMLPVVWNQGEYMLTIFPAMKAVAGPGGAAAEVKTTP